jgi:hypothetical protein
MSDLAEQILDAIDWLDQLAAAAIDSGGYSLTVVGVQGEAYYFNAMTPQDARRRCAADREIVALYVDTKRISTAGWRKANAGGRITDAEAQEVMQADNELDVLDTVLEILARGYGIQP